jgi:hypothetical protein
LLPKWFNLSTCLVFALFLRGAGVFAQHPDIESRSISVGELRCSDDAFTSQLIMNQSAVEVTFIDFRFDVLGPYLSPQLACNRWLVEIAAHPRFIQVSKSLQFRHLYSGSNKNEAHLVGEAQTVVYDLCQRSMFCKISFPYQLFRPLSLLQKSKNARLPPICYEQPVTKKVDPLLDPQEEKSRLWKDLDELDIWMTPMTTFVDKFIDEGFPSQQVSFVSSLTVSVSALRRIKPILKAKPSHKMFVIFETGFDIASPAMKELLDLADDQLILFPYFATSRDVGLFHVKAATGLSNSKVLWTSANFRSNAPSKLVDLGLAFSNAEISASITNYYFDAIDSSCKNIEYLDCPVAALPRFERALGHQIKSITQKACAEFYGNALIRQRRDLPTPKKMYFVPGEVSMEAMISKSIAESTKQVTVLSHQFSNEAVANSLFESASLGRLIDVFSGSFSKRILSPVKSYTPRDRPFAPIGHSKLAVFDSQRTLMGSGNFTENGLNSSGEMFLMTEDERVAIASLRMGRALALQGEQASSYFMSPIPGDQERSPEWLPEPKVWNSNFVPSKEGTDINDSVFRSLSVEEVECFAKFPPSLFYLEDSFKVLCERDKESP